MAKTRVGVLFRESVGGKKSMNKSVDLQKYIAKYYEFCKQLAAMIAALKAHHQSMVKYEETQTQVCNWNHLFICLFTFLSITQLTFWLAAPRISIDLTPILKQTGRQTIC
jgi:cell division protein FtsB